jgi:hypothetical protein
MARLFALLVGIQTYPNLNKLNEAERDIDKVERFLRAKVRDVRIEKLKGPNATKANVARAFQHHFRQAQNDDIGLYYFSGHGGKIVSPPDEICELEGGRDGAFETTVLYDSRSSGGQGDLSDKELAYLIDTHYRAKGHFLAVLDCCFSGDGARVDGKKGNAVLKSAEERFDQPLAHFIGYSPNNRNYGKVRVPLIQIAASEEDRPAVDGVFTNELIDKLESGGTKLSYEQLIRELSPSVMALSQAHKQRPGIYTNQGALKKLPFLGGLAR